jgi:uncharacterized protein YndB with AHSA1/START domain
MSTGKHEFRIERILDAPRQLVWNAWTTPELVMQWWGPNYFTSPTCKIDLRVGGHFVFCMRGPDGTDYWNGGIYREVVPIEKLVSSIWFSNESGELIEPSSYGFDPIFPKEQHQTVTFEDLGEQTKLTIDYEVDSKEILEIMGRVQMREGWETSLDKLARSLSK